jgi:hypothetical protein
MILEPATRVINPFTQQQIIRPNSPRPTLSILDPFITTSTIPSYIPSDPLNPPSIEINKMATNPPAKVKIKTAHPSPFDGSYAQYRPWIREVKIKILANKLRDSQDKILCTLQYMKSRQALEFRDSFLDNALADPDLPNFGTWTDFLTRLDQRFHDPHFQSRA